MWLGSMDRLRALITAKVVDESVVDYLCEVLPETEEGDVRDTAEGFLKGEPGVRWVEADSSGRH